MSDFENEYKKYSEEATPDLWSRIESGIDAYEASNSNITPITKNKKSFKKYLGLIAVAACILITVPAMILTKHDTTDRIESAATASEPVMEAEAPAAEAPITEDVMEESQSTEAPMLKDVMEESQSTEAPVPEDVMEESQSTETPVPEDVGLASESAAEKKASSKKENSVKAMWNSEASPSSAEVIVIDDNIPESKIRFFFTDEISDFTVLNIVVTDITEDGELVYTSSPAYTGGSFSFGDELILEMSFPGDIPN